MRKLIIMATVALGLALPALASAREYMGGHVKQTVAYGAYAIVPSSHGDMFTNDWTPNAWVTAHCLTAYESDARHNWAMEYYSNGSTACSRAATDGPLILKIERWDFNDGTSGNYWTPVAGYGPGQALCFARSFRGQPSVPWGVVDDLFRIHCPTKSFGRL